jgi:ligand-binding sensor domain-containing protein
VNRRTSIVALTFLLTIAGILVGCKSKDNTLAPEPPGPAWVTYTSANRPELRSDHINSLSIGIDGAIWMATDSGAVSYGQRIWGLIRDSLRYSTFSTGATITSYKVVGIAPGEDGSIWFGLAGGGVRRYHPGSASYVWQSYNEPNIAFGTVSGISADAYVYGDIWVAHPVGGVSRYVPSLSLPDQGTWVIYTSSTIPQLLSNQVRSTVHDDYTNTVWFGTLLGATSYHGVDGWSSVELPPDQAGDIVAIGFDETNNVWFGKNGGNLGVTKYNKSSGIFTSYTSENTGGQLPAAGVNALVTDHRKTRWFGTDAGLVRFQDTTWTAWTSATTPELPNDTITALVIDRKSNLWIGTKNGVAVFNPDGTRF